MSAIVTGANQLMGNSSAAETQQRAAFIFDNLLAAGWVRTNDTGQTESNVMTHNVGTNFQIWRMADTLQATVPVFIKVEVNPAPGASNVQGYITIGTGSSGAGVITGILLARTPFGINSGAGSAAKHFFSGSTNRCMMWWDLSSFCMGFAIERSKNADFTDNNEGLLIGVGIYNSMVYGFIPFVGTAPPLETSNNCLIPSSGTTGSAQNVGIYPPLYFNFDKNVNSGLNYFGYRTVEIVTGSTIQATINNVVYTFYASGMINLFFATSRNANAVLWRYE